MSENDIRDDDVDREMIAEPEWGDCSPKIEAVLEWLHSRIYLAFSTSSQIRELSEQELRDLGTARLNAHEYLDADEHAELRMIEREIRRVEAGNAPPGVDDTVELSVAWAELIDDAVDLSAVGDDFDDGGES